MTPDQSPDEGRLTTLLERAMLPVSASEELVAAGLDRGRRAVRRRRTVQALGVGATAVLVGVGAVVAPSYLTGSDDQPTSSATRVEDDTASAGPRAAGQPTAGQLAPYLKRAQTLILDALPAHSPTMFGFIRVDYDPDGKGVGEVLATVSSDPSGPPVGPNWQDNRCDRVTASPAADDCLDTGAGWIFTGPSLPDVSGKDAALEGIQAIYIKRDGGVVTLIAYNAPEAAAGGVPTRPDPVLDAGELTELILETDWFA